MTSRPNFRDVLRASGRSLRQHWHSESLRAAGRLIVVVLACLALGWIGPLIMRWLPSPTGEPPRAPGILPLPSFDIWFVLPALIGAGVGLLRSGAFVTHLYSLASIVHGIRFAISTTFGLGGISLTAKHTALEGFATPDAPPTKGAPLSRPGNNIIGVKIGGPGWLSVHAGTAVITECGGSFSRIVGPGAYALQSFERVRGIIDLRSQSFSGDELALTKDNIPVHAKTSTTFKLMKRMPGEPEPPPVPKTLTVVWREWRSRPVKPEQRATFEPLPASPEALRLAVYEVPTHPSMTITWSGAAHNRISGEVCDALARRYLDQLFAPDDPDSSPRQEIGRQVFEVGQKILAKRGIELMDSGFGNISVPPEVLHQRRQMWQVTWLKESDITKSGGEADGILQRELARAEAQVEFIQSITQAIRTTSETHEPGEAAHPLSLRFVELVARIVDQALRESASRMIDHVEVERLVARVNRLLPPGKTA